MKMPATYTAEPSLEKPQARSLAVAQGTPTPAHRLGLYLLNHQWVCYYPRSIDMFHEIRISNSQLPIIHTSS